MARKKASSVEESEAVDDTVTDATINAGGAIPPPEIKPHRLPPPVVMLAPGDATSASYDGVEYEVVDGHVEVPAEIVTALEAHGFKVAE